MMPDELIDFVKDFFASHPNKDLLYHNLQHTQDVVKHSEEIADFYSLNERERFILQAAAWFHDTGHLVHGAEGHENASVKIMENFFENFTIDNETVKAIAACIGFTRLPSQPDSLVAQILCDADLYHLGTEEFSHTNELVKKELELRTNVKVENWRQATIDFFKSHHFHTTYCSTFLNAGKQRNLMFITSGEPGTERINLT